MRVSENLAKTLSFFIVLLICSSIQGQKLIGEIKIGEGQRNITNLSGSLNDSISFHIIINKTKQGYRSDAYFYNSNERTKVIELYRGPEKPIYVTFHVNNNTLTLIKQSQNVSVIQDVDYLNEITISKPVYLNPKNVFSHKNVTLLVDKIEGHFRDIMFVKSSNDIKLHSFKANDVFELSLLENIDNDKTELIDDLQFLEKGSIKQYRAFYNGSNLVFVNDDKQKGEINLIYFEELGNISTQKILIEKGEKIKKMNSFIKDGFLFTFYMNKETASLIIHNIKTKTVVSEFEYDINKFGSYNKIIINGEKPDDSFKPKVFFKSFFPQAVGSMYNPELYVGVNKTTTNNYIIQVGHVDKNTFQNFSGNNFWWNYPAFSLNYNITTGSLSGGFNPAAMSLFIFNSLADEKRKGNYFELNLDSNFRKINEPQKAEYTFVKIDEYNKRIKRSLTLKRHFYIPFKNSVRMINFNKKKSSYEIYDYSIIK